MRVRWKQTYRQTIDVFIAPEQISAFEIVAIVSRRLAFGTNVTLATKGRNKYCMLVENRIVVRQTTVPVKLEKNISLNQVLKTFKQQK